MQLLPEKPPWGALAGVRPTKLTTAHLLAGGTARSADRMLRDDCYVTPERRKLCVDCSIATVDALKRLDKRSVSVYIGIPFCPTRCTYCSFVSQSIERCAPLLEAYLTCLLREVQAVGAGLRASGIGISTLYIGGGTPTTLNTDQLARLMGAVCAHFDLTGKLE